MTRTLTKWEQITAGAGAITITGDYKVNMTDASAVSDKAYIRRTLIVQPGDVVTCRVMGRVVSGSPAIIIDYPSTAIPVSRTEVTGSYLREYCATWIVPETYVSTDRVLVNIGLFTADIGDADFYDPIIEINGADIDGFVDLQENTTDATPGRGMIVGAFGLGALSIFADFNIDVVDNSITPGWYHFDAATVSGTAPTAIGNYHMMHRRRNSGGGETQVAIRESTTDPGEYFRTRVTVGWSDWKRVDAEHGSNANGSFVKFGDGTLICTHTITTSAAGPVTWTYPSPFSSSPKVSAVGSGATVPFILTWGSRGATSVDWNGWKTDDTRFAVGTDVTAIGRWFT